MWFIWPYFLGLPPALKQSFNCPNASEVTLKCVDISDLYQLTTKLNKADIVSIIIGMYFIETEQIHMELKSHNRYRDASRKQGMDLWLILFHLLHLSRKMLCRTRHTQAVLTRQICIYWYRSFVMLCPISFAHHMNHPIVVKSWILLFQYWIAGYNNCTHFTVGDKHAA